MDGIDIPTSPQTVWFIVFIVFKAMGASKFQSMEGRTGIYRETADC